jgi:ADP-ribose pyrophosphatase
MNKRISARGIIIENDSVYAIYRRKKLPDGKIKSWYATPGGGVEGNESPNEAVIRELKEELSLDVEIINLLDILWEENNIVFLFHCQIINGTPELGGPEKEKQREDNFYEIRKIKLSEIDDENIDISYKDLIKLAYTENELPL